MTKIKKILNYTGRPERGPQVQIIFFHAQRKETWAQPQRQTKCVLLINIWKVIDETGRHDIVQLDESKWWAAYYSNNTTW